MKAVDLSLLLVTLIGCRTAESRASNPRELVDGSKAASETRCGKQGSAIPAALATPPGLETGLALRARGTQRYACVWTDAGAAWGAAVPNAVLSSCGEDGGGAVALHFSGPTWKWGSDLSTFVGTKGAGFVSTPSPDDAQADLPWLLVPRGGGSDAGVMAQFSFVQRVDTRGGQVSKENNCDARGADAGLAIDVPYSATYLFYRRGP